MSEKVPVPQSNPIAIINTNWNVNNIVDLNDQDIRERIHTTLNTCSELLASHCGPLSGYAMLINNYAVNEALSPSLFTRDGIRIMSNVEFMSPLERYFKNLLVYIGSRVDNTAKDGTTTTMLWSCELLNNIIANYCGSEQKRRFSEYRFPIFKANKVVENIFQEVQDTLKEKFVFHIDDMLKNPDDLEEVSELAAKIAFIQALSSSGGDLELASAMRDIFSRSPRETWEYITYSYAGRELEKRYYVKTNPYDYRIICTDVVQGTLDSGLNSQYERENEPVLIIERSVCQGSMELLALQKFIDKYPNNVGLSIVAPYFDAAFIANITSRNQSRERTAKIALWQHAAPERINGHPYMYTLKIAAAISGVTPYDGTVEDDITSKHLIYPTKLFWRNKYLELYGIIPHVTEDTKLHPFYQHPELSTPFYTDFVKTTKELLAQAKQSHDDNTAFVNIYTQCLNDLLAVRRPALQIAGTTHDQSADTEVVRDVLGSIMSSLTHGFLINGVLSLKQAIDLVAAKHAQDKSDTPEANLSTTILNFMERSMSKVVDVVYGVNPLVGDDPQLVQTSNKHPFDRYFNSLDTQSRSINEFLAKIPSVDTNYTSLNGDEFNGLVTTYPVAQPIKVAEEMLRRVHELIIKFTFTNKMVVNGGVIVTDKKERDSHGDTQS